MKSMLRKAMKEQEKQPNKRNSATEKFKEAGKPTRFSSDNQPSKNGRKKKTNTIAPIDVKGIVRAALSGNVVYLNTEDEEGNRTLTARQEELSLVELMVHRIANDAINPKTKPLDAVAAVKLLISIAGDVAQPKEEKQTPLVFIQNTNYRGINDENTASKVINISYQTVEAGKIEAPELPNPVEAPNKDKE